MFGKGSYVKGSSSVRSVLTTLGGSEWLDASLQDSEEQLLMTSYFLNLGSTNRHKHIQNVESNLGIRYMRRPSRTLHYHFRCDIFLACEPFVNVSDGILSYNIEVASI